MRRIVCACLCLLLVASNRCVLGWSEAGHKIVASIAFRQLTLQERQRIADTIAHHPRYEADFVAKMPIDLAGDKERMEWVFQQASFWPDIARGFSGETSTEFHRPTWHYINLPHFLTPEDQAALQGTLSVNTSLQAPTKEQDEMNIVQSLRFTRSVASDAATPADRKAVLLCWILHEVGDIHQPMHSCALFSKTLFPDGDKGGNLVKTQQRKNLHALWDQFPGYKMEFKEARDRAISFVNQPDQSAIGTAAAAALDEEVWLNESNRLALTVAYDAEVMGYLRGYAGEAEAPPLQLSERYLREGGAVSERRLIEAGYRLGAVLKQLTED